LFYNVHETLTVIVSHVYLFYVSFACLGLGLKRGGLDLGLGLGLERGGLGLGLRLGLEGLVLVLV